MEIPPGRIARLAAKRQGRQGEKRHFAEEFPGGCLSFFDVLPQLRKLRQDSHTIFPAVCQDRGVGDNGNPVHFAILFNASRRAKCALRQGEHIYDVRSVPGLRNTERFFRYR
jgi:hypothetical protein